MTKFSYELQYKYPTGFWITDTVVTNEYNLEACKESFIKRLNFTGKSLGMKPRWRLVKKITTVTTVVIQQQSIGD